MIVIVIIVITPEIDMIIEGDSMIRVEVRVGMNNIEERGVGRVKVEATVREGDTGAGAEKTGEKGEIKGTREVPAEAPPGITTILVINTEDDFIIYTYYFHLYI